MDVLVRSGACQGARLFCLYICDKVVISDGDDMVGAVGMLCLHTNTPHLSKQHCIVAYSLARYSLARSSAAAEFTCCYCVCLCAVKHELQVPSYLVCTLAP